MSHYSKVNGAIEFSRKFTAYRSKEVMMTSITVHQSASLLSRHSLDRAGGVKECYQPAGEKEVLLFEFKCPDMLRPSCPSFTLLITCWWGGWWGGWWNCLRDLHLQTYDIYYLFIGPCAHITITVWNILLGYCIYKIRHIL